MLIGENEKLGRFKVTEYITPKEAEAIILACSNMRDRLIIRVMWETGGRVSEVLALIPSYIDPVNNCIYLTNLKQHTASGIAPLKRIYLFPESTLLRDLQEYIKENKIENDKWVFRGEVRKDEERKGQVSPAYVWYLLANTKHGRREGIASKLGIRKIKDGMLKPAWCHLLRHGFAVNTYHRTQRLDVTQHQLGHSTIVTTEGYAELSDDDRKKIINKSRKDNKKGSTQTN
jgi:integrase